MNSLPSKSLRIAVGVLLGVPGTILFGFLSFAALAVGVLPIISKFGATNVGASVFLTVWGLAGFTGLAGFWLWVLQPPRFQIYPTCLTPVAALAIGLLALLAAIVLFIVVPWPPTELLVPVLCTSSVIAAIVALTTQVKHSRSLRAQVGQVAV